MRQPLATGSLAAALVLGACAPTLPPNDPVEEVVWLEQNWAPSERYWYHHATQGTSTFPIPYAWFVALEQPELSVFGTPGLFADPDYLRRFGFIPSPASPELADAWAAAYPDSYGYANPDALPVGFARTAAGPDPVTGKMREAQIGLTCAACHTGHLEYQGVSVRVDGAPAIISLNKLQDTLGLALAYTRYVPFRFDRFADRVLGADAGDAEREQLFAELAALVGSGKAFGEATKANDAASVEEGFGRTDALNRIGNWVFYVDLRDAPGFDASSNLAPRTAPVNFPHVWDTPWFDWVQYDASIMQPMVRNVGEALGVRARLNLVGPKDTLYASSVAVDNVFLMEDLLAGESPFAGAVGFKGLTAPAWPDEVFGPIDQAKRADGAVLYAELCQGCHLPPVNGADGAFWDSPRRRPGGAEGERLLSPVEVKVSAIGTDPAQSDVLANRRVRLPESLGVAPGELCNGNDPTVETEASLAEALAFVTAKTAEFWYDQHDVPAERRAVMNGNRPNCVQANQVYKARPLDGIWATPPFLHNGAVPDLYTLLLPVEQRPDTFCLGLRAFDPVRVGYDPSCAPGTFEVDTSIPGNGNGGHAFEGDGTGPGVIGRGLNEEERVALVEFMKSL